MCVQSLILRTIYCNVPRVSTRVVIGSNGNHPPASGVERGQTDHDRGWKAAYEEHTQQANRGKIFEVCRRDEKKVKYFGPLSTDKSHTDKYYSSLELTAHSSHSVILLCSIPSIGNSEKFLQLFVCVAPAIPRSFCVSHRFPIVYYVGLQKQHQKHHRLLRSFVLRFTHEPQKFS